MSQRLKQFPRESSGGILWDASNRGAQKKEKQRKFEVERRINPRTVRDFELLYNELETWRQRETARVERSAELTAEEKENNALIEKMWENESFQVGNGISHC